MTLGSRLKAHTVAILAILVVGCGTSPYTTGVLPTEGTLQALGEDEAGSKSGFKAYYGIQHTHVAENGDDGQGTLAEAYTYARDKANLDFLGVSSHAHMISDAGYESLKRASAQYTQNGKFVALLAQEWSSISKGGHINIFEANERCPLDNGDWNGFYQKWLPAHPEIGWVQFNHPHPSNVLEFGGSNFSPVAPIPASKVAIDKVAGMALLNGPGKYTGEDMKGQPDEWDRGANGLNYEEEYKEFLNRGWRVGAIGDQDNHVKSWGLATETRTGVWAKSLSKAGIVEAFRSRRTFATFDHNLKLYFTLNGEPMGGEVAAAKELEVEVSVSDPDTTIQRLELYGDTDGTGGRPATLVAKAAVGKKSAKWAFKLPANGKKGYYFAKVVYGDRTAWAWSSPVWVK